jgi:hypothetical protein
MTDISITAANVVAQGSAVVDRSHKAGATITAGQVVYKEASSGKLKLSDNDSATAEVRTAFGVALNGASDGQPLAVARGGEVAIGGTLTAGTEYYLSGTAGGICPRADVTSGDDPIRIGYAKTTSVLVIDIANMGVTL